MAKFKDKDERDFRLYKSTPNQKTSLEFNKIKVGKSSLKDDVTLDPDFWYKNNRPIRREDVDRAISTNSIKELRRISNYFFNTSGMIYKEMKLKEKLPEMSLEEKYQLLSTDGMLVKRPILVTEKGVLTGFKPEEWEKLLKE